MSKNWCDFVGRKDFLDFHENRKSEGNSGVFSPEIAAIPQPIRQIVVTTVKCKQLIGQTINGQKIKGVTFYFSSKPPREVIDALKDIGVKVQWVK